MAINSKNKYKQQIGEIYEDEFYGHLPSSISVNLPLLTSDDFKLNRKARLLSSEFNVIEILKAKIIGDDEAVAYFVASPTRNASRR